MRLEQSLHNESYQTLGLVIIKVILCPTDNPGYQGYRGYYDNQGYQ